MSKKISESLNPFSSASPDSHPSHKNEMISEMLRVMSLEGQAIQDCIEQFKKPENSEKLYTAVDLLLSSLNQGGKIVVTGLGKSGKIGQKISSTLCSTGSLAVFLHPTEGLHGDLGLVQKNDVVLALSYTGNTDEVVQLIPSLKKIGVSIVGIGGNHQSRLAEMCDAWIQASVKVEACPYNLAPTTSTTLALAIGDALAMTLMRARGFNAEKFAQNHPGGSLGRRLHMKVKECMFKGSHLPLVLPNATLAEIISEATQKNLGAVLVHEEMNLLGIITEGDLRRAFQKGEVAFKLKAQEIMTAHPILTNEEMLAQDAFLLMENRKSQISVLPVVDSSKKIQGLIRLHDLVRVL